jgi:hypothetical protein
MRAGLMSIIHSFACAIAVSDLSVLHADSAENQSVIISVQDEGKFCGLIVDEFIIPFRWPKVRTPRVEESVLK